MQKTSSCLVTKLQHYVPLSETDRALLREIEKSERNYQAGQEIYQGGDTNKELFVVKRGWLISYADMPDGRRQIVKIHHPGDIVGFTDIALKDVSTSLCAVENVVLCPFAKQAMDEVFRTSPRLTALLMSLALRDQVVLIDLLRAMGRMSALERIGYMLLDLIARLRITSSELTDRFRLPLNQTQIAQYLGLTNVYISKTFSRMEVEGYIRRDGLHIQILREDRLREMTDFHNRYDDIDISWLPSDGTQA
ncbi:Crp/Fnr family transcriptional regulator [Pseudooceanicola sediminis]|uniref:Crp/Fnr family transcriptional regulator n=1 Tax=Pseudooceanicola sediminis TaxID=2211117 RepID=A0A399IXA3_9RHOB|nr:Crp/Fnr family transcriptional regulator [Pseudooceanicola sediminis]KAA2313171.1 Crp/Fnr family transcriptional regulator [Puniceibacterium sp. HSS470]RII37818.1 Crp/Fnr family transcriptional regulator [Pseudooceanicola sediminis]|tara:strand:- start:28637 stop:29386 length:750 start_codon:yes stop_codon:yes gene_type:complete